MIYLTSYHAYRTFLRPLLAVCLILFSIASLLALIHAAQSTTTYARISPGFGSSPTQESSLATTCVITTLSLENRIFRCVAHALAMLLSLVFLIVDVLPFSSPKLANALYYLYPNFGPTGGFFFSSLATFAIATISLSFPQQTVSTVGAALLLVVAYLYFIFAMLVFPAQRHEAMPSALPRLKALEEDAQARYDAGLPRVMSSYGEANKGDANGSDSHGQEAFAGMQPLAQTSGATNMQQLPQPPSESFLDDKALFRMAPSDMPYRFQDEKGTWHTDPAMLHQIEEEMEDALRSQQQQEQEGSDQATISSSGSSSAPTRITSADMTLSPEAGIVSLDPTRRRRRRQRLPSERNASTTEDDAHNHGPYTPLDPNAARPPPAGILRQPTVFPDPDPEGLPAPVFIPPPNMSSPAYERDHSNPNASPDTLDPRFMASTVVSPSGRSSHSPYQNARHRPGDIRMPVPPNIARYPNSRRRRPFDYGADFANAPGLAMPSPVELQTFSAQRQASLSSNSSMPYPGRQPRREQLPPDIEMGIPVPSPRQYQAYGRHHNNPAAQYSFAKPVYVNRRRVSPPIAVNPFMSNHPDSHRRNRSEDAAYERMSRQRSRSVDRRAQDVPVDRYDLRQDDQRRRMPRRRSSGSLDYIAPPPMFLPHSPVTLTQTGYPVISSSGRKIVRFD